MSIKMKQRMLIILFFLVSCGKGTRSPDGSEQADPYFWKIEKAGKTSYWLGTIHIGVALHEVPCSVLIQERLQESDLVFTEIGLKSDLSEEDKKGWLSPNSEDFKNLNSETQRFLKNKGIKDNLSYQAYFSTLSTLCLTEGLGVSVLTISMDDQVKTVAQLSKIPVKALDDPGSLNDSKHIWTKEDVEQKIQDYPQCPEQARNFVNQYKTGHLNPAYSDDFAEELLKNRNEKWLKKFTSSYESYNQIFVAAGKAHFTGPFNILDMLKEEGFAVQQVSCN